MKTVRPFVTPDRHHIDPDKIVRWILEECYWGAGKTETQIRNALKNSTIFGLYALSDQPMIQVGFARVISDHHTTSVITDCFVDKKYRGLGFGRALMEAVTAHPSVARTICVLATREAAGFYVKFGFRDVVGTCMQRNPTK